MRGNWGLGWLSRDCHCGPESETGGLDVVVGGVAGRYLRRAGRMTGYGEIEHILDVLH
jgi:hypothetical protein